MNEHDRAVATTASELTTTVWRGISMRMSWSYRLDGQPLWLPEEIKDAWGGRVPTFEEWQAFRRDVVKLRNRRCRQASAYQFNYKSEARRAYMKEYMARRRAQKQREDDGD